MWNCHQRKCRRSKKLCPIWILWVWHEDDAAQKGQQDGGDVAQDEQTKITAACQ